MNYITTPIYYASGEPHLGHAYTTILADTHQRYRRAKGETCRLVTGTDEHGQKIARVAEQQGISELEFVGEKSEVFKSLWQTLNIDCDFVRTTSDVHKELVLKLWRKLEAKGDLYVGDYTGQYCVECEQFLRGVDVCPVHRKPLDTVAESGYFFRLSKYQQILIDYLQEHPGFITPRSRLDEALAFLINQPLQDLCVSRSSTDWGIPVPGNKDQVIYVWLDALVSYIDLLDITTENDAALSIWQSCEHFIGKDILIFHAVYWPAILLALDLPLPRALRVNGWLTVEGKKIAKSDPSTIINPLDLVQDYSLDGLRYYLLSCTVGGQDVDFNAEQLKLAVNTGLANSVGNLIGRCAALLVKGFPEGVRRPHTVLKFAGDLIELRDRAYDDVDKFFQVGEASRACRRVLEFATELNIAFQSQEPWRLEAAEQAACLWCFHGFLVDLTALLSIFVPDLSGRARRVLCVDEIRPSLNDRFSLGSDVRRQAIATEPLFKRLV